MGFRLVELRNEFRRRVSKIGNIDNFVDQSILLVFDDLAVVREGSNAKALSLGTQPLVEFILIRPDKLSQVGGEMRRK